MSLIRPSFALAAALALTVPAANAAPPTRPAPAAQAGAQAPAQAAPESQDPTVTDYVDPVAYNALVNMGHYLATLRDFEVQSHNSRDVVTENGQKLQVNGVADIKVRRPNGFMIANNTDQKNRIYVYDGRNFTVYSPTQGYYATVSAPGTIREVVDQASDRYGIELPLADLFYWSDPNNRPNVTSAMKVDDSVIDGVPTQHYAFRKGDADWQVWVKQGNEPLPVKVVITDRSDPTDPQYSATLNWNLRPQFTADTFTFRPGPNAKQIQLSSNQ